MSGLNFRAVSWKDAAAAVTVAELDTGFELMPLLKREVRINELSLRDVDISVREGPIRETDTTPFSVDLPITLRIETSSITNAHLTAGDNEVVIKKILLSGGLSGSSLLMNKFRMKSRQHYGN